MPEAPRITKFVSETHRASEIFVDREEPRALFRQELELLCDARPRVNILTFYGVGGQGKTALCRQFLAMTRQDRFSTLGLGCGLIDLHANPPGGEWHALVAIRNAAAEALGASFPAFDLAFADYWSQAFPHQVMARLGANRLSGLGGDVKDSVADTVAGIAKDVADAAVGEWGKTIADVATELAGGLPLIGPLLKRTSKWAIERGYEQLLKRNSVVLEQLYGLNPSPAPDVVMNFLPDILAHELALHCKRSDRKLVLLVDEYENAMIAGGSAGAVTVHPWDRGLRAFVSACALGERKGRGDRDTYAYEVPLLLVLFGREKIRWADIDPGWAADLDGRQHLLEGLGEADANDYLLKSGITDAAIRRAIVVASTAPDEASGQLTCYPLMLDLAVQVHYDLLALGSESSAESFALHSTTYAGRRAELLTRLLRNYPSSLEGLLRRASCAGSFDRALAEQLISRFAIPFDMLGFAGLERLSFVTHAQDGRLVMHSHIRDTLRGSLDAVDARETHAFLANWFADRAVPDGSNIHPAHAIALAEALEQYALGDLESGDLLAGARFRVILFAPVATILVGAMRTYVEASRERPHRQHELGERLVQLGRVLIRANLLAEAREVGEETLALVDRTNASCQLELAIRLELLGSVAFSEADFPRAADLYEDSLSAFRRALPEGSQEIARTLGNLASTYSNSGRAADASAINEEILRNQRVNQSMCPEQFISLLLNVAVTRFRSRDWAGSATLLEEALAMQPGVIARNHPTTMKMLTNLGLSLLNLERAAEARPLLEEAVALKQADSSHSAESREYANFGLGKAMAMMGEYEGALSILSRNLEQREVCYPAGDAQISQTGLWMAKVLRSLGRTDEAVQLFEDLLHGKRAPTSPDQSVEGHVEHEYGLTLAQLGRHQEAATAFLEAAEKREALFGEGAPMLYDCYFGFAHAIYNGGAVAQAAELFEQLALDCEEVYGPGHVRLKEAQLGHGLSLANTKRLPLARDVLLKALEPRAADLSGQLWDLHILARLSAVHHHLGEPAEAARFMAEATALSDRYFAGDPKIEAFLAAQSVILEAAD